MPQPLDGIVVVANYSTRLSAEFAAQRLEAAGLRATVLSDPPHQIAPHVVTETGHDVVVPIDQAEEAAAVLGDQDVEPSVEANGLRGRPVWMQVLAVLLLVGAVVVPLIAAAAFFLSSL